MKLAPLSHAVRRHYSEQLRSSDGARVSWLQSGLSHTRARYYSCSNLHEEHGAPASPFTLLRRMQWYEISTRVHVLQEVQSAVSNAHRSSRESLLLSSFSGGLFSLQNNRQSNLYAPTLFLADCVPNRVANQPSLGPVASSAVRPEAESKISHCVGAK